MLKNYTKEKEIKNLAVTVAYMLNQYTQSLINYGINTEHSLQLITEFGMQYNLSFSKIFEMQLDLQKKNQLKSLDFTNWNYYIYKHEKLMKSYCGNNKMIAIGLGIPFFSNPKEIYQILLLDKSAYHLLKRRVYRQLLLNFSIPVSLPVRTKIWSQILNIVFFHYLTYEIET